MAPGIAALKGHGWGHFLPLEAKRMTGVTRLDKVTFIVNAILPTGRIHETFKIDQRVPRPGTVRELDRITNQVNEHLDELSRRTGLEYLVIYSGNPEMAQAIMKAERDCPF